jgi:hypothetical protein
MQHGGAVVVGGLPIGFEEVQTFALRSSSCCKLHSGPWYLFSQSHPDGACAALQPIFDGVAGVLSDQRGAGLRSGFTRMRVRSGRD